MNFTLTKRDGTTYELSYWDSNKKFMAVLVRENHTIRDYSVYKTFAGAKSWLAQRDVQLDIPSDSGMYGDILVGKEN